MDLFANHTYEFDFPEDGTLKWNEWSQDNSNYDPSSFNIDDDQVININEESFKDDIPIINSDLSQNDEFRQSIRDSMDRLSASVFIWDEDDEDNKQETENTTVKGPTEEIDPLIATNKVNKNNKNRNKNHPEKDLINNQLPGNTNINENIINLDPDTPLEIPRNFDKNEFSLFQKTAYAEVISGLAEHAKSFNKALESGELNMTNIQAARLNVSGFYTAKIAYWKINIDDKIVKLFKILETNDTIFENFI